MDRKNEDLLSSHEGEVDFSLETPNNLDLNIEQECRSPNVARASSVQECPNTMILIHGIRKGRKKKPPKRHWKIERKLKQPKTGGWKSGKRQKVERQSA